MPRVTLQLVAFTRAPTSTWCRQAVQVQFSMRGASFEWRRLLRSRLDTFLGYNMPPECVTKPRVTLLEAIMTTRTGQTPTLTEKQQFLDIAHKHQLSKPCWLTRDAGLGFVKDTPKCRNFRSITRWPYFLIWLVLPTRPIE